MISGGARNVILLVADRIGFSTITAEWILRWQQRGARFGGKDKGNIRVRAGLCRVIMARYTTVPRWRKSAHY
jgi:hypothetical protein